jgi:hypothetical protein
MSEQYCERLMRACTQGGIYYIGVFPPLRREELDALPVPRAEQLDRFQVREPERVGENGSQILGYKFSHYERDPSKSVKEFMEKIAPQLGVTALDTTIYPMHPHDLFVADELVNMQMSQ